MEVTLVLYPLPQRAIERHAEVIARYRESVGGLAARLHAREIDWTLGPRIDDSDFVDAHDHLSTEAERRLSAWALEHDLAFLAAPAKRAAAAGRDAP
jgi:hypothetical protein